MLTSVAFWVSQVSVVDWPLSMVLGLAVSDAVGAAGGGGGGGGGGATFFLQAPSVRTTPNAITSESTSYGCASPHPPLKTNAPEGWRAQSNPRLPEEVSPVMSAKTKTLRDETGFFYFQLQFGS